MNAVCPLVLLLVPCVSRFVFNSALSTSEQVNHEELAQIREDFEKAKRERLARLNRPNSRGEDSNSTVTTGSSTSLPTVHSRIERLKTRVTIRIQGAEHTDKF